MPPTRFSDQKFRKAENCVFFSPQGSVKSFYQKIKRPKIVFAFFVIVVL